MKKIHFLAHEQFLAFSAPKNPHFQKKVLTCGFSRDRRNFDMTMKKFFVRAKFKLFVKFKIIDFGYVVMKIFGYIGTHPKKAFLGDP